MEFASVLAGERWSDHPSCTHPSLAYLARLVNDHISDDGRQQLAPLIPSVVGRRGNDRTWLAVAVAVAAQTILDVPEAKQRALAAGLLQAERLCADAEPDLAATRQETQLALGMVPGAGQAAMPASSTAASRRSQSGSALATTPSTAHRTIVGAQRLAKVFASTRPRTPSRSTQATAPGTIPSAS